MASIQYRVKTNNDLNSIYLRFKEGNKFDIELSTGKKAKKGKWSKAKQKHNSTTDGTHAKLNKELADLKSIVLSNYEAQKDTATIINSKWLKLQINNFFNRETNESTQPNIYLTSFVTEFLKTAHERKKKHGVKIKKRTVAHYKTTLHKLVNYENSDYSNYQRILFSNIDEDFYNQLIEYLRNEEGLNNSSIDGYLANVRLFCREASKTGIKVNSEYDNKVSKNLDKKTKDTYLTDKEIETIFNTQMPNDHLKNAKQWLIIGVWTGLRVSDLLRLDNSFLKGDKIVIRTKKTDTEVKIPLHPNVIDILNINGGNFPRKISDQKFNAYIKKVCSISGINQMIEGSKFVEKPKLKEKIERIKKELNEIKKEIQNISIESSDKILNKLKTKEKEKVDKLKKMGNAFRKEYGTYPKHELISSHTCRRSFATNLHNKVDTYSIMKTTGHKSEKQFLNYIKVTSDESAERIKSYWDTSDTSDG